MTFNWCRLTNSCPGQGKDGKDSVRIRANHGSRQSNDHCQVEAGLLRLVEQIGPRPFLRHAEMAIGIMSGNATSGRTHDETLLD